MTVVVAPEVSDVSPSSGPGRTTAGAGGIWGDGAAGSSGVDGGGGPVAAASVLVVPSRLDDGGGNGEGGTDGDVPGDAVVGVSGDADGGKDGSNG